jgi:ubiquinone/menaquinone biosynthesis C-methylase UbiE
MKPSNPSIESPLAFRELIYSFQVSRIILSAYELDIFSQINNNNGSASTEVANALETDPHATDRLMNALCAIGFLNKNDNRFYNTEFSSKYLSRKSKDYLKGFHHTINMWDTWTHLTEVVRTGKTQRGLTKSSKREDWAESFIGAMHERASLQAKDLIDKLPLDNIRHMLDIGGGSGVYAMEFVKKNAANTATVFDLPEIIPITRKYVENEGLTKCFGFIAGDYNSDSIGKDFDFTFLSAIVHINSQDQNRLLVKKCFDVLNPGGIIVIQDQLMNEDRTQPYAGALFAINMLVGTECGDTYTEDEIRSWMTEAGFSEIIRIETFNNAMLVGKRI